MRYTDTGNVLNITIGTDGQQTSCQLYHDRLDNRVDFLVDDVFHVQSNENLSDVEVQ